MSDRDKFDAWFDKEYPISGDCGRIKYRESSVGELMIAAWQASRRAALEEAAGHITRGIEGVKQNGWIDAANERLRCADAVRALAEGDKQ